MDTTTEIIKSISQQTGKVYYESDWLTLDSAHLTQFAWSTYLDDQYVNLAPSRANPYGPDLIDGFLLLGLLTYFRFKYAPRQPGLSWGLNYGLNRVRFITPVTLADSIRLVAKLTAVSERAGGVLLDTENSIYLKNSEKPAMVADWLTLSYGAESHE